MKYSLSVLSKYHQMFAIRLTTQWLNVRKKLKILLAQAFDLLRQLIFLHIRSALSSYRLCRCFQGSCYCPFLTRSWGRLECVIDSLFPAYYEVVMITNYVGPLKVSEHKYMYVITLFNYRSFEDQWLGCMRRVNVVIVHTISKWLHWPFAPHCMNGVICFVVLFL